MVMRVLDYIISEMWELFYKMTEIKPFAEFPKLNFYLLFIGLGCSAVLLDIIFKIFGDSFYDGSAEVWEDDLEEYEPTLDDDDY